MILDSGLLFWATLYKLDAVEFAEMNTNEKIVKKLTLR